MTQPAPITLVTHQIQGPPGPIAASAANTAALAVLPLTNVTWPNGTLVFVQASGGTYWSWYPTGTTAPAGSTTTAGNGGVWVQSQGGAAIAETAATVSSGQVYQLLATDTVIRFDTSGGTTATADMIAPTYIGQRITFYWWAWGTGQVAPTINVAAGNKMVPFSGQASSGAGGLVTTTTISTPGAAYTLEWSGTMDIRMTADNAPLAIMKRG